MGYPQTIVNIPGVYEIVSRHFNSDILEMWEYEQYIKVKEIVERIELWNPDFQRTIVLLNLLNKLTEMLYETLEEKPENMSTFADFRLESSTKNLWKKYSAYPIWTCDFEGSCLVGAEKFEIEPIDLILHRFGDD